MALAFYVPVPRGLQIIFGNDDGCESVKLAMQYCELGCEECYLDDIEDMAEEYAEDMAYEKEGE